MPIVLAVLAVVMRRFVNELEKALYVKNARIANNNN